MIESFLTVADVGGFSSAARQLAKSPASLTRDIQTLEGIVGGALFQRTTRQVILTPLGERYESEVRGPFESLVAGHSRVSQSLADPAGPVFISVPVMLGELLVPKLLETLRKTAPLLHLHAQFSDRNSDFITDGLDLALRVGVLSDSPLWAKQVGVVRRVWVASPELISEIGGGSAGWIAGDLPVLLSPVMQGHSALPARIKASGAWYRPNPIATVQNVSVAREACLRGIGATQLLSYQVADALQAGTLLELEAETQEQGEIPVSLLHRFGQKRPAAILAVEEVIGLEIIKLAGVMARP